MSTVADRVRDVVQLQSGCADHQLHAQIRFRQDLGMDSLDEVELLMSLEEEFDLYIPDDAAETPELRTLGGLIQYLERELELR